MSIKIVKFLGGLGNQMFQYAFYLALQKHFKNVRADLTAFKTYALHNGFELHTVFNIKLEEASPFELNLLLPQNRKWIWRKLRRLYDTKNAYWEEQPQFIYHDTIFEQRKSRYYWGYWQHIEYINMVADKLRNHFQFPNIVDKQNTTLIRQVENRITVALHVRRGDYLTEPLLGGICDEKYYDRAIAYMQERIESPLFVIFSNDIKWCQTKFRNIDSIFVDWNIGTESYRDMQLMHMCNHFIIANSSFSWWAAWLGRHPEKIIISPNQWVTDPSWDTSGLILPSFKTL